MLFRLEVTSFLSVQAGDDLKLVGRSVLKKYDVIYSDCICAEIVFHYELAL